MDFFNICTRPAKGAEGKAGAVEVYPDFIVGRSKDLMVRGQSFYAIWDETNQTWTTDLYAVAKLVDLELNAAAEKMRADGLIVNVKYMTMESSGLYKRFQQLCKMVADNSHQLDASLTFANDTPKKSDYSSMRLAYSLTAGECKAWDQLIETLYDPEERAKIEWAIGAIVSGDSKRIEKFLVLYGAPGTGKGTILKIIELLFDGYSTVFEAENLVGSHSNFATEPFQNNPLVAIQHDGDLSRIESNAKLNAITGHDPLLMNIKFKPQYKTRVNAFCLMGTNYPVKISDAQSGIIRRLIDVNPSGRKLGADLYQVLTEQVKFELGAIAYHCLEVYRRMGKNAYRDYKPTDMMGKTNVFFNFIDDHYDVFKSQDFTWLKQSWDLYKEWSTDTKIKYEMSMYKFREELKHYFNDFEDRKIVDGKEVRKYYAGFRTDHFTLPVVEILKPPTLVLDKTTSILDEELSTFPAVYASHSGEIPGKYWTDEERMIDGVMKKPKPSQVCSTILADLNTSRLHFTKVPDNHIVIDFDLKGPDGQKSLERNLEAAAIWPTTYAELSKSGAGVHLHYNYVGAALDELAAVYADGIEVKVFRGGSSLRRKLTKCNDAPIANIDSGLEFKEKKVIDTEKAFSEKRIRGTIAKCLRKEVHSGTKPNIDLIAKVLEDAYKSGEAYDLSDLKSSITAFAIGSSNQSQTCLRIVNGMKWKTDDSLALHEPEIKDDRLVFFDIEVYKNLLVICWKVQGVPGVNRMINPTPVQIQGLFQHRLVGFNCRKYDNHILWAAYMGASNMQLYQLSQKIINSGNGDTSMLFGQAYNLSYADVYDFAEEKRSLKKWEIELKIHHREMDLPWDEPVPEDKWLDVVEYCCNDVEATEIVFDHESAAFTARKIVADMSGLTVNDTTQSHVNRILHGNDRNPQKKFVYTDLSEMFPGYKFDPYAKVDKSTYRGMVVGEGGFVYPEPGMYENVGLLDIASMHPTSIKLLNLFGENTANYVALMDARLAIKHGDFDAARKMFDGRLAPYLVDEQSAAKLDKALKLILNSTYGFTAATYQALCKDPRNIDNIVAKRGALYMIDLLHDLQAMGIQVVHIKTDSVKIPNITPEIVQYVKDHGARYGYTFEHEATYKKFCLVNAAVYVAYEGDSIKKGKPIPAHWTATGAQFQNSYVFKTLFTGEPIVFEDYCVPKEVKKGHLYLDFDTVDSPMFAYQGKQFVGRVGLFVPIQENAGGGTLVCLRDGKETAPPGTKGYHWVEAELMEHRLETDIQFGTDYEQNTINMDYFNRMVDEAVRTIEKFGDFYEFSGYVSDKEKAELAAFDKRVDEELAA